MNFTADILHIDESVATGDIDTDEFSTSYSETYCNIGAHINI